MKREKIFKKDTTAKRSIGLYGYSLIEILIYMALLGIFLFGLTNMFVSSIDLKLETEANSSVEQDGRYILSRLRYDIINSSAISLPASVGAQGNTMRLTRGGINYTYTLSDGNLMVSDGVTSIQMNSPETHFTAINFKRLGNIGGKNTITISYTLESEAQQSKGTETRNYELTYGIR